ncbi:MAG: hypothetical protein ACRC1K_24985, partial [Planctomycetia bacterium]
TIRWDGGHRRKVSVIGAVTASPGTRRLGFQFATIVDGDFKVEQVVEFLKELLRRPPGKVVVIWDGGGNQKGRWCGRSWRRPRGFGSNDCRRTARS